jgi:hypothetical protein
MRKWLRQIDSETDTDLRYSALMGG